MNSLKKILEFELITIGEYSIKVYAVVIVLFIFIITKTVLWLIKKALFRKNNDKSFDTGNTYALFKIIKYVIWVISIGFMLETIGVQITLLIAGSAALLVGIGLGLQQTFNDVLSGIILLSER